MTRKPNFDQMMIDHQVKWRKEHIRLKENGYQNDNPPQWILPKNQWEEGLWNGIKTDSKNPLPRYLDRNKIQKHKDVHNLKSSWVLCSNMYFPFRNNPEGLGLLAEFLHDHVDNRITSVDRIELEYAEEDSHQLKILGEERGKRGSGQTSPDVAFIVNGSRGIVLTEVKFTEHSFYRCSARKKNGTNERPPNPDPDRCNHITNIINNHRDQCHQCTWGRKYWDILQPIIDRSFASELPYCPASRAGYQLFRQQALAEGIAKSKKYDFVISCVAMDARNDVLKNCLVRSGFKDIARDWARLFPGEARFALFTHQQWVQWVRDHDKSGNWVDWLDYISKRYGI